MNNNTYDNSISRNWNVIKIILILTVAVIVNVTSYSYRGIVTKLFHCRISALKLS